MRNGTFLVNTARGKIVVMEDLLKAARTGIISGFGFDVYPTEPPANDEFTKFIRENSKFRVSITHHAGFYAREALMELRRKAASETYSFLKFGRLRNRVS